VGADSAETDARGRDSPVAAEHDVDGSRDAGKVADLALELQVGTARPSRPDWDPDLGHDLVRVQTGGERTFEEACRRQHTLATGRLDDEFGTNSEHHRTPVTCRIRMADGSSDGPHVADERIGDERRRVEQHVERPA
jgi:hypothetical protein